MQDGRSLELKGKVVAEEVAKARHWEREKFVKVLRFSSVPRCCQERYFLSSDPSMNAIVGSLLENLIADLIEQVCRKHRDAYEF